MDEILNYDKKPFNLQKSTFSANRQAFSATAHVKEFQFDQKTLAKDFNVQAFGGTKTSVLKDQKFATADANTKGKFEIPNADKAAASKGVAVKDAVETGKALPVRDFADAEEPIRGADLSAGPLRQGKGRPKGFAVGRLARRFDQADDDRRRAEDAQYEQIRRPGARPWPRNAAAHRDSTNEFLGFTVFGHAWQNSRSRFSAPGLRKACP